MVKGNLVVSQSGGPTAVINNSLVGVVHEALTRDAVGDIYGALNGIEGVLSESIIDLRQEAATTLETLRTTPGSALGMSRRKLTPDDYGRILDVFKAHNVRYFFYIGGNDSMDTCNKVSKMAAERHYELYVMGVPKTVDNDLVITDHCPGYGSAARFVANTVRDTGFDTESGYVSTPVKIVEMMGRHAGWVTAAAVLGKKEDIDPPHLVYIPERPVKLERHVPGHSEGTREVRRRDGGLVRGCGWARRPAADDGDQDRGRLWPHSVGRSERLAGAEGQG